MKTTMILCTLYLAGLFYEYTGISTSDFDEVYQVLFLVIFTLIITEEVLSSIEKWIKK